MTYRDDTETVRAENERMRRENATLRSTRWRRRALAAACVVANIAILIVVRRGGAIADALVMVASVALWSYLFLRLRRE